MMPRGRKIRPCLRGQGRHILVGQCPVSFVTPRLTPGVCKIEPSCIDVIPVDVNRMPLVTFSKRRRHCYFSVFSSPPPAGCYWQVHLKTNSLGVEEIATFLYGPDPEVVEGSPKFGDLIESIWLGWRPNELARTRIRPPPFSHCAVPRHHPAGRLDETAYLGPFGRKGVFELSRSDKAIKATVGDPSLYFARHLFLSNLVFLCAPRLVCGFQIISVVPEPSTWTTLGLGTLGHGLRGAALATGRQRLASPCSTSACRIGRSAAGKLRQ